MSTQTVRKFGWAIIGIHVVYQFMSVTRGNYGWWSVVTLGSGLILLYVLVRKQR